MLIAIGLAITFGVMGVINMAHGELMMLGAYTTYTVQTLIAGPYWDFYPCRDSGGFHRCGIGRRSDGTNHHPFPLRTSRLRHTRDLRCESHIAAGCPVDIFGAEPFGDYAGLDERFHANK